MLRNIRVGSPVSRAVRHVLERVNFKAILGGNLAVIVLTSGTFVPTVGSSGNIEPEITIIEAGEATLPTEVNVRYPVVEVKFNQGFHYFHKGIDLDGETGDKVYPIAKGIVTSLGFERFTLGNTITVKHDNGLESVYAHLSRIDVREGDEVDPNKPLGKLGSTGRSTGPHLHLEVYKDGRVVNPRSVLGYR
tara:strand:+ start:808 stop:1380 length:573 start_codon:yes stop_codon:yes gene_type:complete